VKNKSVRPLYLYKIPLFGHKNNKMNWLQEEHDEHGQGKWEGKQKGKNNDERITESKARQKESTTLCKNLAD
jgi:hypothetical protein